MTLDKTEKILYNKIKHDNKKKVVKNEKSTSNIDLDFRLNRRN